MNDTRNTAAISSESVSEDEAKITLGLLNAIEANSKVTQRSVASELGIALGLANAYLKRCARKGLIKVQQVPANRYAYYLTPQGFAEKSRLTAEYLTVSLNFFRRARSECAEVFEHCEQQGWQRAVLAGAGDLAEIATLCANDSKVALAGIYDPQEASAQFASLPVAATLDAFEPFDVVIVTAFRNSQQTFDGLIQTVPADRVVAPALLGISREPPELME